MRPSHAARPHPKPIASCKPLARLKSIATYRGTSVDAPAVSLAVSKSQHRVFNETDLEMGQEDVGIAMDLENDRSNFDGDTDATRSYSAATASDVC